MAKRLLVAYGLWALGGPLGLHHIYLGRDSHALLWMVTLGGFGAGWLWDFWHLPAWVATANGARATGHRGGTVPALSPLRLAGQVTVGTYFGAAAALGLPWVPALLAQPLAVGLGVQLVSSVGDQTTEAPSVLAAAFLASLLFQGRALAVLATSLAASTAAQRHRRYKPRLRGLAAAVPGAGGTGTNPLCGDPTGARPGAQSPLQHLALARQVLGVPAGSPTEDVHRSYRELVKLWHPDHNRHRAEEAQKRFIELQEAYEELAGPRRAAAA
ncbi:DJC22 protein, partial [Bucorvus abyssinicus]|nr:DJC22 protein [Bucorvus abyssinicus]